MPVTVHDGLVGECVHVNIIYQHFATLARVTNSSPGH